MMFKLDCPGIVVRTVSFIAFAFSATVCADDADWLIERYKVIVNNPDAFQQAYNAGRERATLCSYCHGLDGNSLKDEVPNLAEQNPLYLWTQIDHFANGSRKNFVMQALAKNLSNDDKLNLAIYFSSKKVRIQKADSSRVKRGSILYGKSCTDCHGEFAHGNQNFARLAGQKDVYLVETLKSFKMNANKPDSFNGTARRNKNMETIVSSLTDDNILDLAAFLSSQP